MAYDETKVVNVKALKDTASRIKTEYLAAISKAGHARFQKAETVPTAETAEDNVLYLVMNAETGHYDVYALIDGSVELLDDTTVSLEGYITEDDLAEALNGVGGGAVLMDAEAAEYAGECMSYDVAYGYGRDRFPGLDLCAKSGTAEIGDGTTHAWFVGYLRTGAPVAFAVMLEHGGGGLLQAGGVANSVLQTVMEYYSDD